MPRIRWQVPMVLLSIAVVACNGAAPSGSPPAASSPATETVVPSAAPGASATTLPFVGTLQVGTTCLAIAPDDQPPWPSQHFNIWELRLPDGYTTTANPTALIGPDGQKIAEVDERIEVIGTILREGSTCLSNVLQATEIRAAPG